ncbi:hypothetical protein [Alsobacter sp. R-9]
MADDATLERLALASVAAGVSRATPDVIAAALVALAAEHSETEEAAIARLKALVAAAQLRREFGFDGPTAEQVARARTAYLALASVLAPHITAVATPA